MVIVYLIFLGGGGGGINFTYCILTLYSKISGSVSTIFII